MSLPIVIEGNGNKEKKHSRLSRQSFQKILISIEALSKNQNQELSK